MSFPRSLLTSRFTLGTCLATLLVGLGCRPSRPPKSRNVVVQDVEIEIEEVYDEELEVDADSDDGELAEASATPAEKPYEWPKPIQTDCLWAESPIVIDGSADEEAWLGAKSIEHFQLAWLGKNIRPPRTGTKAKVLWDKEYFYFFAEMEDADLYANVKEHDGQLWDNDVFELFFKPSTEAPGYYEFQVNAAGAVLDMFLPRRNSGGFGRFKSEGEFDIEAKVKHNGTLNNWRDEDQGWSVEGRIPWKGFEPSGGGPKDSDVWTFALCRYDYSVAFEGPELSSTAPYHRLNYHRWEDYEPIRFVGSKESAAAIESSRPHGIAQRTKWTTSKVVGTAEPPLPYRVKKTYENLSIKQPLGIYPEPGTKDKLLMIQHTGWWAGPGRIVRLDQNEQTDQMEELLLFDYIVYGLAFHPKYEENGYLYLGCNGPVKPAEGKKKKTTVFRYTMDRKPPYKILPDSRKLIIDWESDGHNGGDLGFSPTDGMLYITSGDGTSDSDTNLTGQDVSNLNATVIRIDVDHPDQDKPYSVPKDNPFVDLEDARPEIWAYGFRNPWRMTFDKKTGHLWVGQNGQDLWEQVYLVERGANYGWSIMEGSHEFYLNRKRGPTPILMPTVEHHHSEARSLTGGVVYHGKKLPELSGAYLYGDWSTGKIWAVKHDGKKVTWHKEIADTSLQIGGFGLDHYGELFVVDQGGGIYRLEETPKDMALAKFPRKLSESGLFVDVAKHQPDPGLIPYSVNAPQWADGAHAERYLALPGRAQIDFPGGNGLKCPDGSVMVKTLSLEMEAGNPESRRRIETQLLHRHQGEWIGYSYAWNDAQSDAVLVDREGMDRVLTVADPSQAQGHRKQAWRFASRSECMACHSRAANYLLGVTEMQLNKIHDYEGVKDNQLRALAHIKVLKLTTSKHANTVVARINQVIDYPRKTVARNVDWLRQALLGPEVNVVEDKEETAEVNKPAKNKIIEKLISWKFPHDLVAAPAHIRWARKLAVKGRDKLRAEVLYFSPHLSVLPKPAAQYSRLYDPYDQRYTLEDRARSYLHANCACCHVPAGGGNAQMELQFKKPLKDAKLAGEPPRHHKFGILGAQLVAPADPYGSVLLYRMAKLGGGRMPRLGSYVVDERGVQLIHDWIKQLDPKADGKKPEPRVTKLRQEELATVEKLRSAGTSNKKERDATVDRLLASTSGAMILLSAWNAGELDENVRTAVLQKATASTNIQLRDLFEKFVPFDQRIKRLGTSIKPEEILSLKGVAQTGKNLFFNASSVQCKSCHRIGEGKELVGPDLSHIGKKYTRKQLLETILSPSKQIDQKYVSYLVETSSGKLLSGLLVKKDDKEIVLKDAKSQEVRLPAEEVEELARQGKSIMPELLLRDMTAQQVADLIAYLRSLK